MSNSKGDGERIAVVENQINSLNDDVAEVKADVKAILTQINQMTGGKRAVLLLFSILGAAVGTISTLAALLIGKH